MCKDKFKKLSFNELTLRPLCPDETGAYKRAETFARTIMSAGAALGTMEVEYADFISGIKLAGTTSLYDICSKSSKSDWARLILQTCRYPYMSSKDEALNIKFQGTSVSMTIYGNKLCSRGLAAAYVYGVPSIGFNSEDYWNDVMHELNVTESNQTKAVEWPCLTLPEHLQWGSFDAWTQDHSEICLVETKLRPEEKKINLRDDHGSDVLYEHALKLCKSKYVLGVWTSLNYEPKFRSYIRDTTKDGFVDIVLFRYDKGFSMRVKTTGRNIRETNAIAKILAEKYGK